LKIFISWSGTKSKEAAIAIRSWLPDVMQFVKPWMSDLDIPKGAHWPKTLSDELAQSQAGVICVTHENREKPWLLFEAGSLARNFADQSRVCVLLIDLGPEELPGPLALYQAAKADEDDAWRLLLSLNRIAGEQQLDDDRLRRSFERHWPDLHSRLSPLKHQHSEADTQPERSMLQEILLEVRDVKRDLADLHPDKEQFFSTKIVRSDRSMFGSGEEVVGRIDSSGDVFIYELGRREPVGKIKGSDDGCLLTSACCEFMGLPDDCLELDTLRKFRDEFLITTDEGQCLIREYYEISPRILAEIEVREDRDIILFDMYKDLVTPSVEMVRKGRRKEAVNYYRRYTFYLANRLLDSREARTRGNLGA
jgi:hypothetical protein